MRTAPTIAAAALAACAAAPAAAEVRFGNSEAGGPYRVSVMSWWEIPFRTIVRQQYDFSCGSAAAATLLSFHYDRPTREREAFATMWKIGDRETIRKVGFSMFDIKNFLAGIGFAAEGFRLSPQQLARLGRPSIVLIDLDGFKHFVVVKGSHDGRILVGDSVRGLNTYTVEEFGKVWNGIALAVTKTPDQRKPAYNLAKEWRPWSQAPLDEGEQVLIAGAGDLTSYLPPSYQITPQILIPVRIGTVD